MTGLNSTHASPRRLPAPSREERTFLADRAGVPLSETWRRALRLYAAEQGTSWPVQPPRPQPGESEM